MKKNLKPIWIYLTIGLLISLTILIIQNINGHEKDFPKIVFDINSGVIGAILTTIITLLLLSNQTEIQELQTKNSVIYEEKLKLFIEFLNTLSKSLEDGKLTPTEMKTIIFAYSSIRLHLSSEGAEKIEAAIKSIDGEFFYVDENQIPRFDKYIELFNSIINVFRQELYADKNTKPLPEFDFDNFKEIAFQRRSVKQPIYCLQDILNQYGQKRDILHTNKEGTTYQFKLSDDAFNCIKTAYEMIDEIHAKYPQVKISKRYLVNQFTINEKKYLGLLFVYYYAGEKQVATLGISEKNRVYFKIKLEKESVFAFEVESMIHGYKDNIEKDLVQYFKVNSLMA